MQCAAFRARNLVLCFLVSPAGLTSFDTHIHTLYLRMILTHPSGESGLGKTTLINTLFSTELSSAKNYSKRHQKQLDKLTEVEIIKAELEEGAAKKGKSALIVEFSIENVQVVKRRAARQEEQVSVHLFTGQYLVQPLTVW